MTSRLGPVVLAGVLAWGCAEDTAEERPPRLGDCEDCGGTSAGPPVGGSGSGNGPADGGGDGGSMPADAGTLTLSGQVFVFDNEDFTFGSNFSGEGIVGAEGPLRRVKDSFSGDSYSLAGVRSASAIWADLEPESTSLDAMKTILRVDPRQAQVDLAFARRGVLEDIGSTLLNPEVPQDDRGHALLRFVDQDESGIAGISVTDNPGGVVTYDTGSGVFRDDFEETSQRGAVLIFNASALPFPGSVTNVTYAGARSGVIQVKFAADTVTVMTVRP